MLRIFQFYKQLVLENRRWLKIALGWFAASLIIGVIVFFFRPDLLLKITQSFQDRFGTDPGLTFHLAMQIFFNNLIVAAIALFGGLLFGLPALIVVVVNGFIIGFIIVAIFSTGDAGVVRTLGEAIGGLVPHGIFELSAFFLSSALGLRLGWEWLGSDVSGRRFPTFKQSLLRVIQVLPLIIGLLFIAALLEVFVSGQIVGKF